MAKEWFAKIGNVTLGPFEPAELKALAGDGGIRPDNLISKGAAGPWSPASKVKGLFPAIESKPLPETTEYRPAPAAEVPRAVAATVPQAVAIPQAMKVVPTAVPWSQPVQQPVQQPAPEPAKRVDASQPEQTVLLVRKSIATLVSPMFWGVILTPLLGLGLLIICRALIRHMGWSLVITNKRTTLKQGIFAVSTNEVRHRDVRDLQTSHSVLGGLLGYGNLAISSSGQAGYEIVANGIGEPKRVAELIRQYAD